MSNGRYKIEFEDGTNTILYEDVILKFDLLIKKKIEESEIDNINKANLEYDVYYVALNSIKSRIKSVYELKMFLKKKEYPDDLIELAVDKLIKQGYLDDREYAKLFISNKISSSNFGPYYIEKELLEKKINSDIINEEITIFTADEQISRIKKLIDKAIKTNRTKGGVVLKQKIYNDLKMYGYDISLINEVISSYIFEDNNDIAKREYDKLYKKYSRKYSGEDLKRVIKEKMYMKGLKYEE